MFEILFVLGLTELISLLVIVLFWAGVLGGLLYLGTEVKTRLFPSSGDSE